MDINIKCVDLITFIKCFFFLALTIVIKQKFFMKKFIYFLALTGFAFFQSCEELNGCKTCGVQVTEEFDPLGMYAEMAQEQGYDSYGDYILAEVLEYQHPALSNVTEELCGEELDAAEAGTGLYTPIYGVGYSITVTCD